MKTLDKQYRLAVIPVAIALLSACGSSGGDDDDNGIPDPSTAPFAVSTKADVVTETSNFIGLRNFVLGESDEDVDAAALSKAKSFRSSSRKTAKVSPKAAVTENCEGGGTYTTDEGDKSRTFRYFPQLTVNVTYFSELDRNCKETADGETTTYNGYYEDGYSATAVDGVSYDYAVSGRDGVPVTERTEGSGYSEYEEVLGSVETRYTATTLESRYKFSVAYRDKEGNEELAGTYVLGSDSIEFRAAYDASGATFNGPYRYSTTECAGGSGSLATVQALSFDDAGYPTAGQIRISNSNNSGTATVTFNADGSATYQLAGGATGTITRAELLAREDNGC